MDCLSCSTYVKCGNPKKDYKYSCAEHKKRGELSFDMDNFIEKRKTGVKPRTDDEFDIQNIFSEALAEDSSMPKDLRIDDRDIWTPPNFVEFCRSHKGLGQSLFARQMSVGTIIFNEWCPRCSDAEWIYKNIRVDDSYETLIEKTTLLNKGVCPKCSAEKSELILNNELNPYIELAACVGQRAGKSVLVSYLMSYLMQLVLRLQKPCEVYGMGTNTTLHINLIAITFEQAKDTLWDPIYLLLKDCEWFKEYHGLLDTYGKKFGELYKFNDQSISYRHRNLSVSPQGPDKRKLRGRTRIGSAIDELAWFDNDRDKKRVKIDATQIHTALDNSLFTVRSSMHRLWEQGYNNVPTAYGFNISSPSSMRDKIMELYNASENSRHIYGIKLPTWEFNPNITREDLASAYATDPVEAEQNFGANPPLSDNPFIGSFPRIELCFGNKRNPIQIKYGRKRMRDGESTRFAKITNLRNSTFPGFLALDAGSTSNSFACAVGHLNKDKPVIDMLVEVQPLPSIPINYTKMLEEIIGPIIEARNIVLVISDRWQHIKMLHDIENEFGIRTLAYSLRYSDMWLVRQMLYDNEIKLPKLDKPYSEILRFEFDDYPQCFAHDPVSHFVLQAVTVKDTGNQVTKGRNLTDDIFRAVMLCCSVLILEEYKHMLEGELTNTKTPAIASLKLFSGSNQSSTQTTAGGTLGVYRSRT